MLATLLALQEAWELEKWRNLKQQEMFQREITFKQRQKQDLDALMKRIQSGREEQKKQRQVDLERYAASFSSYSLVQICACGISFAQLMFCLHQLISLFSLACLLVYRLLQRYQNVKAELQQQQNLERIRHEKFAQRSSNNNSSSSNATVKGRA